MRRLVIQSRGQEIVFSFADDRGPGLAPLLISVVDWYERACVTQVPGFDQGESPSTTVTISNEGGAAARMLDYPLDAVAIIRDDASDVLVGRVVRYSLGPVIELSIEV